MSVLAEKPYRNVNYINGEFCESKSGKFLDVINPATGELAATVNVSTAEDVAAAAAAAKAAGVAWRSLTVKRRAAIMFKYHQLLEDHLEELVELVVLENGKNRKEAEAGVLKGNETVEWACGMAQQAAGRVLEVSRGVTCQDFREPLGTVACICPFNFPAMVPMWTVPIALAAGNCVIVKPSEKVPSTLTRMAELFTEAGVPPGVFQLVHGQVDAVNGLIDHPDIDAVTFVGSSRVAEIVAQRAHRLNKRVLALGGAKNHLIALDDCDHEMAAQDIVASYAGCAGQRCMAASVLITVGEQPALLDAIVARSKAMQAGQEGGQMGPVIDAAAKERILGYIAEAEKGGARVLVDGRAWCEAKPDGYWIGPTVLLHASAEDRAMKDEIFGPVLSVYVAKDWDEAIAIENGCPYGNAASIYTSVGAHAEWWSKRFRAAMIGVNIGIPVPREPFSFGGLYGTLSTFGNGDITGDGCMEFMTKRRKVTTKWSRPAPAAGSAAAKSADTDKANFDGQM